MRPKVDFVDIAFGLILRHEGFRAFVYRDTVGKETVGIGRNLTDKGISREEAEHLARNDIAEACALLIQFPWFGGLSDNRKAALIDMTFDLQHKILEFHNMIAALERGDYEAAAADLLDSLFAKQTGNRAEELAQIIRQG